MGRAAVPSGASTGSREAIELRDGDAGRFIGQGRPGPSRNINTEISEAIIGLDAQEQAFIDQTMIDLTAPTTSRAWRQRHPGRFDGGRQGRRRGIRPAALPLLWRFRARCRCRCR